MANSEYLQKCNRGYLEELMDKPLILIEANKKKKFELNQRTVELLHQLDTPVVVVGVAGLYRSGKSYLMNLMAGKTSGFDLGSTVQAMTKGIWIWCRPHPIIPNTTLILMDTEGLQDANDGDDNKDMQIIVLALLLSSTFIYNTTGRLDNSLIKELGFVSELTKFIQVRSDQPKTDEEFDYYFPILVVTVRDFCLELAIDGETVTSKEYFEFCLKLKESSRKAENNRKIEDYNEPRIKIRKYFPDSKRHCYVLPAPVKNFNKANLKNLANLPRKDMNPEFLEQSEEYLRFIMNISEHKRFGDCDRVNGRMFADITATYLTALLSDEMPCIQSTFKLTAMQENRRIVDECLRQYEVDISNVVLPVTQEELIKIHNDLVAKLTDEYKKKIIFEESEEFQKEFENNFKACYQRLETSNIEASRVNCEQILESLGNVINTKYGNKCYLCPGGYDVYSRDLNELKNQYENTPNKGVLSDKILSEFLQKKKPEMDNIIAIDKEMTTSKIKEEGERALRNEIQLREKMLRDEIQAARIRDEALKKSLEETNRHLQAELEKRLNEQQERYERTIADRQAAQERVQRELNQQIQNLQTQKNQREERARQEAEASRRRRKRCTIQ